MEREEARGIGARTLPGVITVMLAMTMFLILSLVLVSLEAARMSCERTALTLNLQTAMASVSGEYDSALFDNYGIYGVNRTDIEELLSGYLKVSENSSANRVGEAKGGNGYLLGDDITEITITNPVSLLEGGGVLVKNQMIAEGAVNGVEALAERLLDAAHLLDATGPAGRILSAKLAVEQELAGMDYVLLELMRLLDGAPVSAGGYTFDENGNPLGPKHFVKCFVTGNLSKENVSIENDFVYRTAVQRMEDFAAILSDIKSTIRDDGEITSAAVTLRVRLLGTAEIVDKDITEAITVLASLEEYQKKVAPMVKTYESILSAGKDALGSESYEQYCAELDRMQRYVGLHSGEGYDFTKMKQILIADQNRLRALLEVWGNMERMDELSTIAWQSAVADSREALRGYSLHGLLIDYGEIKGHTVEQDAGLWNAVKEFLINGFDGYLFGDAEELSQRILLDENLPSANVSGEEKELFSLKTPTVDDLTDTRFLDQYLASEQLSGLAGWLQDGMAGIGEKLLLISYLNEHFEGYTEGTNPGVLAYEKEYLLFGAAKDRANLRRATLSIFGIRALMNVIYAVSDPTLSKEALAATGILAELVPFAAVVIQYAILTAIGLENALLETMELLDGKTVPLIESKSEFQTGIKDIFNVGKTAMHTKAKTYTGSRSFGLNYSQYLLIFMMITDSDKLVARAMDLIQGNLRLSDEEFLLSDCLYSFGVTVTTRGRHLFTNILDLGFGDSSGGAEVKVNGAFAY